MNIVAFVLAIIGALCFLAAAFGYAPRTRPERPPWALLPLGLAFITAAWIFQLIWLTDHVVRFGNGVH